MNIAKYASICYATEYKIPCALVWYLALIITIIAVWYGLTHKKLKDAT